MMISQRKKDEGIYCCAYACTNTPAPKKGGLCSKHYARKRKNIDPVYDRYNKFIYKSKRRGLANSVTLEEFRAFCKRTGYIINKGYRGQSATIDRRCNAHGYHIWNMQILTNRANASKGNRTRDDFVCPF